MGFKIKESGFIPKKTKPDFSIRDLFKVSKFKPRDLEKVTQLLYHQHFLHLYQFSGGKTIKINTAR
jgi:hypothetical protein